MKKNNKKVVKKTNVDIMELVKVIIILVFGISVTLVFQNSFSFGKYKEGTYFGYDKESKDTAVVYVDSKGKIKSVKVDAVYIQYNADGTCKYTKMFYGQRQCVGTTKQILKEEYGMKKVSSVEKEWYEQADVFANKVIKEQGLDWMDVPKVNATELNVSKLDGLSSVTIDTLGIYNAVNNALEQARK
jgi:hypothetical protein